MRCPGSVAVLFAMAAGLGLAVPAAAQTDCATPDARYAVAPAYLDDTEGDRSLGVVTSLSSCRAAYDTRPRFPRARYLGLYAGGTIPFTSLAVPPHLEARASYGSSICLCERAPDDFQAPLDEAPDAYAFHYGYLGLGARIQYEASNDLDEQGIVGAVELRWVDPSRWILPSTVVSLEAVKPTRSGVRDDLDLERAAHGRVSVRGYWLVPLGGPLSAEIEGAYFWGLGLDAALAAEGFDGGAFVAGELVFGVDRAVGRLLVESIFVGYAHGQRPTAGEETRAWSVGVALGSN
jgi:hypothetical protein